MRARLLPIGRWFAVALFGIALFCMIFALNMQRGVNHDEHQFVAAGRLIAAGLQPYADFPYFHGPTLGMVYAVLFAGSPPLLLTARLFSVLCGWLSLLILFAVAYRTLAPPFRLAGAVSAVTLLAASPLFIHSSGRAWNHDLPVLLLLLAYLVYVYGGGSAKKRTERLAVGLAGMLMGLAAGVRLSFALLAPAFLFVLGVAYWRRQHPVARSQNRFVSLLVEGSLFTVGWLVGFAPVFWYAWQAPEPFWFGNVEYIRLNTLYYHTLPQPPEAMTLAGKLLYFVRLMGFQPGNLLLLVTTVALLWPPPPAARPARVTAETQNQGAELRLWLLSLLAGFAFLGALAATPSQWQYFYPLMPLAALSAINGLAVQPFPVQRRRLIWLLAAAVLAALLALPSYAPGLARLWNPAEWSAWRVHARSAELATLVDGGRVLTLAPIYPLERETPIEPALATGPFAWRVADQVPAERRRRLGLLSAADLPLYWAQNPPRGVLVGAKEDDAADEAPLIDQAQSHGYVPVLLPDETTLWLSPRAGWGETIRLGGHTLPQGLLEPGSSFVAIFYLQASQPISTNLNVLVQVVGRAGVELMRSEGWPWGSPTSTWAPGEVWPDGHAFTVPPATPPGVYRVDMSFYDPATLETLGEPVTVGYLHIGEDETAPAPAAPLAEFGAALQLLRAAVAPAAPSSTAPGATVTIQLDWQAAVQPAADYTVFVHLVGSDGVLVAQQDAPPLGGFYPTREWRPGQPVADEMVVVLPEDVAPGVYRIFLGLYDSNTLQRLPVSRQGQPVGDALELGSIQVGH